MSETEDPKNTPSDTLRASPSEKPPSNPQAPSQAPPKPPLPLTNIFRRRLSVWGGLLTVYLLLFATTGYVAFLPDTTIPSYDRRKEIDAIQDVETKAFIIEVLKDEEAEHKKRKDVATQSFHVVLGALLGFMSASAASLFSRATDE